MKADGGVAHRRGTATRTSGLVLLISLLPLLPTGPSLGSAEPAAEASTPTEADREVDRLVGLCKAWTAAKFLHPWMFSGAVGPGGWDRAFVEAVPAVREARVTEEYGAAVAAMLGTLDDPATRIADPTPQAPFAPSEDPPPLFRRPVEGVVLVDAAGYQAAAGGYSLVVELGYRDFREKLLGAEGLIFDLRIPPETSRRQDAIAGALDYAAGKLVPGEVRGPVFRWPVHWGYHPQRGSTSGGYRSTFVTSLARAIQPEEPAAERTAAPGKLVFLTNGRTKIPGLALALRGAGYARIVAEAPLSEDRIVDTVTVELGEGIEAEIRASELVPTPWSSLGVDLLVEPAAEGSDAGGDPALAAALELLEEPFGPAERPGAADGGEPLPAGVWRADETYPEMLAPDASYRMLAACRLWGTIEHFYPYLHLIGDWEGSFRAAIPEFLAEPPGEGAAEAYARAVLRLAAEVEDGHTTVWGGPVEELTGPGSPPAFSMREIEGRWVVTELRDLALEGTLGVGDEIHAANGVPLEEGIARYRPLVTASTETARRRRAAAWAMLVEAGPVVTLPVSGADGVRRDVEVPRGELREPPAPKEAPPYRLLEGEADLGYVDLMRLEVPQVEELFLELGGTDGMIFDLRGYPRGTAWAIAPRINDRGAEVGARFRRREVSRVSWSWKEDGYFFAQPLPEGGGEPPYEGEIVVLIDDRAISQSEHSALFFEAAADVTFVGTPTAGANGDVTSLTLPGGITVYFTGHDVRWPDGRQLQRVGVLPDVHAEPTIEGIRAGEDEVLAKGVEVLRRLIGEPEQP